jgi:ATP-binding cassette subfamily F protein uup
MAESVWEVRGDGEIRQYTGNWSDWAAKRSEEDAPAKTEKPKAAPAERVREKKLKFSFKEEREFATIEEDIAALEEKIEACLAAQGECASDYVKLQQLQEEQAQLEEQLACKEERWLYLTELKEQIDAAKKN